MTLAEEFESALRHIDAIARKEVDAYRTHEERARTAYAALLSIHDLCYAALRDRAAAKAEMAES